MIPASLRKSMALSVPTTPNASKPEVETHIPIAPFEESDHEEKNTDEVPDEEEEQEKEFDSGEDLDSDEEKVKTVRRFLVKKTVYWFQPEYKTPERVKVKVGKARPAPRKSKSVSKK